MASDLGFCEGPVWTRSGRLLIVSIDRGCLYDVTDGQPRVIAAAGGGPNGLTEGEDGTLYVAQSGLLYDRGQRVAPGAEAGIQAVRDGEVSYVARGLETPNDLCFGPDGRLYFTDPRGTETDPNRPLGRVYALELDGQPKVLAEGPNYANGIAFDADGTNLFVAETFRARVLRYSFQAGRLREPDVFCTTEPGYPDGMCFDTDGRLYVAATLAHQVLVFAPDGTRIEALPCGDTSMPTNCCFGDAAGTTLYVTESMGHRVLAFDMASQGLPLYPFRG